MNNRKTFQITWANLSWILDYRKVLIQPEHKIIILSDIHIGLYSSLRAQGSYLPTYDSDLLKTKVSSLLKDYPSNYHWIIAGDIKHNHGDWSDFTSEEQSELFDIVNLIISQNMLTLVVGDHDRGLEDILLNLNLLARCTITHAIQVAGIIITHKQEDLNAKRKKNAIVGHIHPVISYEQLMGKNIPIFVITKTLIILPAFNDVAGGYSIKKVNLKEKFDLYGVVNNKILMLGIV